MTIQNLPAPLFQPRVETGVVQFGNDWPGVFIRGDNALHFAHCLDAVLSGKADGDPITRLVVDCLLAQLRACGVDMPIKASADVLQQEVTFGVNWRMPRETWRQLRTGPVDLADAPPSETILRAAVKWMETLGDPSVRYIDAQVGLPERKGGER